MKNMFDSAFYHRILNQINSNVYITDIETDEIVYMNDYMKQTFHLENVEGKICWQVLQKGMTKRCGFCKIEQLKKLRKGKACVWREKNTITGRIYMNHDRLEEWNGRWYYVQNSVDITEQVRLSMEATTDELTGVLNRSAGKKQLEDLLNRMDEQDKFTIALYDINGLKWVNDTYGHLEGDRLLMFVAQNIQDGLEGQDFVFRLSGDEFIVVFVNQDQLQAEQWFSQMLKKLEARRIASGMDYDVSFSYGLATIHGGGKLSVSDVLSIADTQMYIQKRDYHIMRTKRWRDRTPFLFPYNKEHLFEVLSNTIDDYIFIGNLKTGEFIYSYKMIVDSISPARFWKMLQRFGEKKFIRMIE